jgi:hypothetical protein
VWLFHLLLCAAAFHSALPLCVYIIVPAVHILDQKACEVKESEIVATLWRRPCCASNGLLQP